MCTKKWLLIFKRNGTVFVLISMLLLVSSCILESGNAVDVDMAQHYRGDIRITASGDIEGTDKISRNGNVYTLTENIDSDVAVARFFISIERDGAVFDGAGKTLQGINVGTAIAVIASDVTIKNVRIVNFGNGIEVGIHSEAVNIKIIDNYFETRWQCLILGDIYVQGVVSGNTLNARNGNGVLFNSNGVACIDNKFINCSLGILHETYPSVVSGNTINGKALVFLVEQTNQVIDGAGQVVLINCTNIVIQNADTTRFNKPIELIGV